MSARRQARRDRGIILVVVLWAVAIMSVIVVGLSSLTQKSLVGETVEAERLRLRLALDAATELGKAMIVATPAPDRVFLDGVPMAVTLTDGREASIAIRDAAGLVDLNQADTGFLAALARASGVGTIASQSFAADVEALRKRATPETEGQPRTDGAPPPTDGEGDGTRKPLKPFVFASIAQARPLIDAPADAVDRFLSLLGLYGATGPVNPLAAPEVVLGAIPGIAKGDLATVASVKTARQWKTDQRFSALLERLKDHVAVEEPKTFVIDVRLDRAGTRLGGRRVSVVTLSEGGPLPFQTLAVSW